MESSQTMEEALEDLGSRSFRMSRDVADIVADSSDAAKRALGSTLPSLGRYASGRWRTSGGTGRFWGGASRCISMVRGRLEG